jgi:hypothetical protein
MNGCIICHHFVPIQSSQCPTSWPCTVLDGVLRVLLMFYSTVSEARENRRVILRIYGFGLALMVSYMMIIFKDKSIDVYELVQMCGDEEMQRLLPTFVNKDVLILFYSLASNASKARQWLTLDCL